MVLNLMQAELLAHFLQGSSNRADHSAGIHGCLGKDAFVDTQTNELLVTCV